MSPRSIEEYAAALRPRYLAARKREQASILTEFCRTTGYHRKSAIRLLHRSPRRGPERRGRPRRYGPAVAHALYQLWEASGYLCAKRLVPFLSELIAALERHRAVTLPPPVRRALLRVSAPTVDRLLQPLRPKGLRRPYLPSPATAALQAQIPIRTFGEWTDVRPGALQADLVLHCGESTAGFYLTSLLAVDVATGWVECEAVWGLAHQRVGTGVHHIRQRLPFPVRELHTDNGAEFLNQVLFPWCRREGIRFTRGRPYKKNDQAYVEQKAWSVIRRLIGYDRYATKAAYEELFRLYALLPRYLNFFHPVAKLVAKARHGAKVTKRYDRAQTPYQRLRVSGVLDAQQRTALEGLYLSLNPIQLRGEIDASLQRLWRLADRPREVTPILRQQLRPR